MWVLEFIKYTITSNRRTRYILNRIGNPKERTKSNILIVGSVLNEVEME